MGIPVAEGPYVYDGLVHILQGEAFRVEPKILDESIIGLQYTAQGGSLRTTFALSLRREEDETVLYLTNPHARAVRYRLVAGLYGDYRRSYQRICVAGPQAMATARWESPVQRVIVSDLQFVDLKTLPPVPCWQANFD